MAFLRRLFRSAGPGERHAARVPQRVYLRRPNYAGISAGSHAKRDRKARQRAKQSA